MTVVDSFAHAAIALTLAGSSGSWSNAVDRSGIPILQVGLPPNEVRWGVPYEVNGQQSGLAFTGVGGSNLEAGQIFPVGTLYHFNKTLNGRAGGIATAADLAINLAFSDPLINPVFNFSFTIDETTNDQMLCPGELLPCPDLIGFSNAFASEVFNVGGIDYTLELLGFQNSTGQVISQFISQENGLENNATLFARVSAPPPPPTPLPIPTPLPETPEPTPIALPLPEVTPTPTPASPPEVAPTPTPAPPPEVAPIPTPPPVLGTPMPSVTSVPEPTVLIGLALVGLSAVVRGKKD